MCGKCIIWSLCCIFATYALPSHVSILEWVSFPCAWYKTTVYGGLASSVLNFGSWWKWVVSFSHRLLYVCGKNPSKRWVGPIVGAWEKRSIPGVVLQRFAESQNATPSWSTTLVITRSVKVSKDFVCAVTCIMAVWILYGSNIRLYICLRYSGVMVWIQMKYIWRPYTIRLSVIVLYISSFVQPAEFCPVLC